MRDDENLICSKKTGREELASFLLSTGEGLSQVLFLSKMSQECCALLYCCPTHSNFDPLMNSTWTLLLSVDISAHSRG